MGAGPYPGTSGSAGPSRMDLECWKRILCSKQLKKEGKELSESIVEFGRLIATKCVNAASLEAYIACILMPLDKRPGVR